MSQLWWTRLRMCSLNILEKIHKGIIASGQFPLLLLYKMRWDHEPPKLIQPRRFDTKQMKKKLKESHLYFNIFAFIRLLIAKKCDP